MTNAINKELIIHLIRLEEDQQNKVLAYIKSLLAESLETSIDRGLKEFENGLGADHQEVMQEMRRRHLK